MIHTLTITPDKDPNAVKKEARKLAMTGGYEIELLPDLPKDSLLTLYQIWSEELKRESFSGLRRKSCISYRVLSLVKKELNELPTADRLGSGGAGPHSEDFQCGAE
ncbi:MAG: hypothetical protein D6808_03575 [Candidatus Dadabacteria bacterium]|nr:MAG: hypothetical protein D6808_03575 [Candidatus Dadabacteria bacterium]